MEFCKLKEYFKGAGYNKSAGGCTYQMITLMFHSFPEWTPVPEKK